MIISASRRTDIPALYPQWFMNRLEAEEVLIPNPFHDRHLTRVSLVPEAVDCIVFWTKNPIPLQKSLTKIQKMGHPFYFQYTLTPYGKELEGGLPPKAELEDALVRLGDALGKERVHWRYDPILMDDYHSLAWHQEQFERMCETLSPYAGRCIISFLDIYRHMGKRFRVATYSEMLSIAKQFSKTAQKYGLSLFTCAEKINLSTYGIQHSACIDPAFIEQLIGRPLCAKQDKNQRPACLCAESVDVGVYHTCTQGCAYCYANSSKHRSDTLFRNHDSKAPMLIGYPSGDEVIKERRQSPYEQMRINI